MYCYGIEPRKTGGGKALKKVLIHKRTISVNCYETDEERLVIEGYLTDERLFPYVIHALNEKRDAGLMHHIRLTMELAIPQMDILSIKAEMPVIPDAGCNDVKEAVQKLTGRRIQPGFTNEVKAIFGQSLGCVHLTNLILAMSSAAVQGLWSYFSRSRDCGATLSLPVTDGSMLLDSCYMWRKDGPFVKNIRQRRMAERKKRC
jgi:hypothetical protein